MPVFHSLYATLMIHMQYDYTDIGDIFYILSNKFSKVKDVLCESVFLVLMDGH